jgi:integrase
MSTRALTDIAFRNLKPRADRYEVPDPGARGLYVVVQPTGGKRHVVRGRINGETFKITLDRGLAPAAARKLAAAIMHDLDQGVDPRVQRKAAKAAAAEAAKDTLHSVCAEFLKREGANLRSADQRKKILDRLVYKKLGDRQIDSIERIEITRLLDQIEDERGPVMADTVLAVLRRVFNWHAARSNRFSSPIVRGMARTKPKERARDRVLNDIELKKVWDASGKPGPFPALVRFLLLTATRRNEAACMTWAELDTDGAQWTIPAARYKNRAHGILTGMDMVIPLSKAARAVLSSLPRIGTYVFTTTGRNPISGFSKWKRAFDKQCGVTEWSLHDLRRSARSLLSRAGIPSEHARQCLGHVIVGVDGGYDRHDYRREKELAFESLSQQIGRVVSPQENVLTLRR